ncbi:MAG: twin-arginine translocase subunit TatC [Candidatus Aenigmarchaeota archaeon]|nr:twin-arginine translocase subunit TatC [Candidatus Aenigmarchaeota archaeon]
MDQKMGIENHLRDLKAIFVPLVAIYAIIASGIYIFFPSSLAMASSHLAPGMRIISFSPTEYLQTRLYASFAGSLLLSSPLIMLGIYKFCSPGLVKNEKRFLSIYSPLFLLIVFISASFSYAFISPLAVKALMDYGNGVATPLLRFISPLAVKALMDYGNGVATPLLSVSKLASFSILIAAITGVAFEMPLAASLLTRLGIVNKNGMKSWRKYFYATSSVIAFSVVSPPILSVISAVLLIAMYEVSILASGALLWR